MHIFINSKSQKTLFTHHNTKAGVYGRLSVMQGTVCYFGFPDGNATEPDLELIIEAGSFGISPPLKWHRIELLTDDTWFNNDFFADPDVTLQGAGIGKVVKDLVNTVRAYDTENEHEVCGW